MRNSGHTNNIKTQIDFIRTLYIESGGNLCNILNSFMHKKVLCYGGFHLCHDTFTFKNSGFGNLLDFLMTGAHYIGTIDLGNLRV